MRKQIKKKLSVPKLRNRDLRKRLLPLRRPGFKLSKRRQRPRNREWLLSKQLRKLKRKHRGPRMRRRRPKQPGLQRKKRPRLMRMTKLD